MTLTRLDHIHTAWDKYPRVDILAAAYLDYKPQRPQNKERPEVRDIGDLIAELGLRPGQTVSRTMAGDIVR